jgi:hypothetical protein
MLNESSAMLAMTSCIHCAGAVDPTWSFCPFCGGSQAIRKSLFELLGRTNKPLKARELSRLLSVALGSKIKKSQVNRILYRLMHEAIVLKDANFAWSLTSSKQSFEPSVIAAGGSKCVGKLPKEAHCEQVPFTTPTQIGHWMFDLNTEVDTGRAIWNFRCVLCAVW